MKHSLIAFLLVISSLQASAEVTSTELFNAINERLSYMQDVALFKAQNNISIENIERDNFVLDQAKISAQTEGLDPSQIEDFFKAQIAVAKAIQFRYRADFLSDPSVEKPKDLETEVRPAVLALGNQIIRKIAVYVRMHGPITSSLFAEFNTAINTKYVTTSDKKLLFTALQKVELLPVK